MTAPKGPHPGTYAADALKHALLDNGAAWTRATARRDQLMSQLAGLDETITIHAERHREISRAIRIMEATSPVIPTPGCPDDTSTLQPVPTPTPAAWGKP